MRSAASNVGQASSLSIRAKPPAQTGWKPVLLYVFAALIISLPAEVFSNGSDAAAKFLEVPEAVWSYTDHRPTEYAAADLEPGIHELLSTYAHQPKVASIFHGYELDLNVDGVNEVFVQVPNWGGTGGPFYLVAQKRGEAWVKLGHFQGSFHLVKGKDEWMSLVVISRGGAEHYSKTTYSISNERLVRGELWRFDKGEIRLVSLRAEK